MEPYNVKIITFPDNSKQVRIYRKLVEHRPRMDLPERDPFNGQFVHDCNDFDQYFDHIQEVSMKRTKKKVYDYAKCNEWDYFVTFTFNKNLVDRYDYEACSKKLSKWFNHLRRTSPLFTYIVVPEQHKDGAWHFHGLVAGLCESEIVWSGKYVVKRVKSGSRSRFVKTDQKIFQIGRYKLGWMTATEIQDKQRVISYITKYVTKDMMKGLYGKKRYWSSKNLLSPTEETMLLDATDRFVLSHELLEDCSFHKVSQSSYGDMTQCVEIFDLRD